MMSQSLALIADAWHTLSDSISSIIVLISAKITSMPADKDHPFGHGRADLIASLIIGAILGFIGFNFLKEGIQKLISQTEVQFKTSAIVVTIISVISKEALAQYSFWAGRKTGYETLFADGWHHRSDAISSVVVLVGILVSGNFWWIDAVLSIVISLLIFQATYEIMKRAVSPLMGERPSENLIQMINAICEETTMQEVFPHHFHMHRYGNHTEMTFHIKLDGKMSLSAAHAICEVIEEAIREKMQIEATIHFEPLKIKKPVKI